MSGKHSADRKARDADAADEMAAADEREPRAADKSKTDLEQAIENIRDATER